MIRPRRLLAEPLESRCLLATLGMGIRVLADDDGLPGGQPAAEIDSIGVGEVFWIEVLVEDQRANPQGITSLPLNLSWDSANIELLNPPTAFFPAALAPSDLLTASLPQQRFVDSYPLSDLDGDGDLDATGGHRDFVDLGLRPIPAPDPPTIAALRGASLPPALQGQAIGVGPTDPPAGYLFARLNVRAGDTPVADTPFTMQVAGSIGFADADFLEGVNQLVDVKQTRPTAQSPDVDINGLDLAVTEFITITEDPPPAQNQSISGSVFADTDMDGTFDETEVGLPNVQLRLLDAGGAPLATTTTGPNGFYLFDDLQPGDYTIEEIQPAEFVEASVSPGTVLPANVVRGTAVGFNQITGVTINAGEHGVAYNFGENIIASKRAFLASADRRLVLCESLGLSCLMVDASSDDDAIAIQTSPTTISVQINQAPPQEISTAGVDIVFVDAGAGRDNVVLTGSSQAEQVRVTPDSVELRVGDDFTAGNFGIYVFNAEQISVNGQSGTDSIILEDSVGSDSLSLGDGTQNGRNRARLSRSELNQVTEVIAFDRLRAISQAGTDTATINAPLDIVFELIGNWIL